MFNKKVVTRWVLSWEVHLSKMRRWTLNLSPTKNSCAFRVPWKPPRGSLIINDAVEFMVEKFWNPENRFPEIVKTAFLRSWRRFETTAFLRSWAIFEFRKPVFQRFWWIWSWNSENRFSRELADERSLNSENRFSRDLDDLWIPKTGFLEILMTSSNLWKPVF